MNEEWTDMINICIRDQCSFDFLKYKYNLKYYTINPRDRPILKMDHSDTRERKIK